MGAPTPTYHKKREYLGLKNVDMTDDDEDDDAACSVALPPWACCKAAVARSLRAARIAARCSAVRLEGRTGRTAAAVDSVALVVVVDKLRHCPFVVVGVIRCRMLLWQLRLRVVIVLPRIDRRARVAPAPPRRIAVVDDDSIVLFLCAFLLVNQSISCLKFTNIN